MYSSTRNVLAFVNTTAIAYRQNSAFFALILASCNSSCVHKRQDMITSTGTVLSSRNLPNSLCGRARRPRVVANRRVDLWPWSSWPTTSRVRQSGSLHGEFGEFLLYPTSIRSGARVAIPDRCIGLKTLKWSVCCRIDGLGKHIRIGEVQNFSFSLWKHENRRIPVNLKDNKSPKHAR